MNAKKSSRLKVSRREFLQTSSGGVMGFVLGSLNSRLPSLWAADAANDFRSSARSLTEAGRLALAGFMTQFPERTPRGHRTFFGAVLVPEQRIEHCQWDDGDGTARALDAWWMLRAITGDQETGRQVEQGQWRYLRNLLHPDTGLVYVADHCGLEPGKFYYHLWDQGRTFRHLVHRYRALDPNPPEQAKIGQLIRRLVSGLHHLSKDQQLPSGQIATYFERDAYWNDQPLPNLNFGPVNFQGFCIGCAQILEPQAMWAELSDHPDDLKWAQQLAAGFIAGFERRRESRMPMFADNGAAYGHFHCVASGLVGLVKLGRLLYLRGQPAEGKRLLQLAGCSYQWMLNGSDNLDRVVSCGYSPENSGSGVCGNSELCSAADVIELAAALAGCADLDAEFVPWTDFWDDVERFTRSEILRAQLPDPELTVRRILGNKFKAEPQALSILTRFRGGWIASRAFPNELVHFVRTNATDKPALFSPKIEVGGCCLYSGPRALYACWSSAVKHENGRTQIRQAIDYHDAALAMHPLAEGGLLIQLNQARRLEVRPPARVAKDTISATVDGRTVSFTWSADQRWMRLTEVQPGNPLKIQWTPARWISREVAGPVNNGQISDAPTGRRIEFELTYRDNELVDLTPKGSCLPFP